MARYEYRCEIDGSTFDLYGAMGSQPDRLPCICLHGMARRVFDFQFQQDNRRLRKGISPVTGQPFAESRAEERRIEKERGIEFVGPGDMPKPWREARDYKAHIDQGGERLGFSAIHAPEPDDSRPLTSYMDEAGFKKSEATHDPTPEHQDAQLTKIVEASK